MTRPRPSPFPVDSGPGPPGCVGGGAPSGPCPLHDALGQCRRPGGGAPLPAERCPLRRSGNCSPSPMRIASRSGGPGAASSDGGSLKRPCPLHLPSGLHLARGGGRSALLWRLPLLESVYRVAAKVEGLGPMTGCQWWVSESSFDAVVDYQEGFMVVLWTGPLESETHIQERIGRLGPDLELRSYGAPRSLGRRFFASSPQTVGKPCWPTA